MGMPLTPEIIRELCEVAVATAKKSVREDEREHPLVGALLAESDGNILATSFRGETPKRHAEFCLLEKVASQGIEPSKCTLFVTLEPCIKRPRKSSLRDPGCGSRNQDRLHWHVGSRPQDYRPW